MLIQGCFASPPNLEGNLEASTPSKSPDSLLQILGRVSGFLVQWTFHPRSVTRFPGYSSPSTNLAVNVRECKRAILPEERVRPPAIKIAPWAQFLFLLGFAVRYLGY